MSGRFNRSFITLNEFDNIIEDKEKIVNGKAVFEIKKDKCELFIWVQNLIEDMFYNIYLIFIKDEKRYGVYITDIFVDETGKGQLKFIFKMTDVLPADFYLENFDAVAITMKNNNSILTPLLGFKKDPFLWNNSFIEKSVNINSSFKYINTNSENVIYMKKDFENNFEREQIKNERNSKQENNFKHFLKSYMFELKTLENILMDEEIEEYNGDYKDYIFKKYKPLEPFKKQNRNVSWRSITEKDMSLIPELKDFLKNNTIINLITEKTKFIFGNIEDEIGNDYYFGVSASLTKEMKNKFFKLGFFQFKCILDKKPEENDQGYFLFKL